MKFNKKRELFVFTEKEKKGIIVLLCILFILIAINLLLPSLVQSTSPDTSKWQHEIDEFLASQQGRDSLKLQSLSVFNPNETDSLKLRALGVSSRVAGTWAKYLKKGGRFKTTADVRRVYGMTPELFGKLEPFINIPEEISRQKSLSGGKPVSGTTRQSLGEDFRKRNFTAIELNMADSAELENLPGIGPVLASRIVRFREILGGFYDIAQLKEVYGLKPEHFLAVSPFLSVEKNQIKKINLNFSTFAELRRHPYIGYRAAIHIVNYRDRHGKFHSVDEITVMGEDSVKKLIPYLVFE